MNPTARKTLWGVSVLGIAASAVIYGLSWFSNFLDGLHFWLLPLFAVFFVLQVVMAFHHKASTGTWRWGWNELYRGKPVWIAFWFYLLMASFTGHLIWMGYESGKGVPAIIDGEYVLEARGHIYKELSEDEYFRLSSIELRMFASLYLFFYFVHAAYWYLPAGARQDARDS